MRHLIGYAFLTGAGCALVVIVVGIIRDGIRDGFL